jgi:hypothetical protein
MIVCLPLQAQRTQQQSCMRCQGSPVFGDSVHGLRMHPTNGLVNPANSALPNTCLYFLIQHNLTHSNSSDEGMSLLRKGSTIVMKHMGKIGWHPRSRKHMDSQLLIHSACNTALTWIEIREDLTYLESGWRNLVHEGEGSGSWAPLLNLPVWCRGLSLSALLPLPSRFFQPSPKRERVDFPLLSDQ